jgi:hypothetical protein
MPEFRSLQDFGILCLCPQNLRNFSPCRWVGRVSNPPAFHSILIKSDTKFNYARIFLVKDRMCTLICEDLLTSIGVKHEYEYLA